MDKARVFPNRYFKGLTKERRVPKRKVFRREKVSVIMIKPNGDKVNLTMPKADGI